MTKNTNTQALNEFIGTIAEITERLAELQAFVDNHMEYSPDEINYGHVGDAKRLLGQLTELTDIAYRRGEYAE